MATTMQKPSKKYIVRSYQNPKRPGKLSLNRFNSVLLFAAILLGATPCRAQVAVALSPTARQVFWCAEAVGVIPCAGGTVTFFNAGTSVAGPVYTDSTGTVLAANPVVLDVTGAATPWLVNQGYDVVLKDSSGVQQWKILNVNPYQILISVSSIILQPQTSDPAGQGGALIYRSDIPCLRFFTTGWDCVVTLGAVQTLTNKTIDVGVNPLTNTAGGNASGHLLVNNGTKYADSTVNAPSIIVNATITGTLTNGLVKLTGAPSTAVSTAITDTGGVVGVCVANCGTTGSAVIQTTGVVPCVFDGGTTASDYVVISPSAVGNCRDTSSATFPNSGTLSAGGQLVGRVLTTNGGAGTYAISLFGPEIRSIPSVPASVQEVYTTASGSVSASIGSTPMLVTSGSAQTLRFGGYITQTVLGTGCVSNTTIVLNIIFKDPNAVANQTQAIATFTVTNNGTLGIVPMTTNTQFPIYVRTAATQTTSYSTTYTAGGSCAPAPSYQFFPMLEQF